MEQSCQLQLEEISIRQKERIKQLEELIQEYQLEIDEMNQTLSSTKDSSNEEVNQRIEALGPLIQSLQVLETPLELSAFKFPPLLIDLTLEQCVMEELSFIPKNTPLESSAVKEIMSEEVSPQNKGQVEE